VKSPTGDRVDSSRAVATEKGENDLESIRTVYFLKSMNNRSGTQKKHTYHERQEQGCNQ
jgi:hypothetical protein